MRSKPVADAVLAVAQPASPFCYRSGQDDMPRVGVDVAQLFDPWGEGVSRLVDVLALLVAAAVAAFVEYDVTSPFRPAIALCFFLAVPGWLLVRLAGAKPSNLSAFGAIGLSVAMTQLGGELLVTQLDWAWRSTTTAFAIACAVGLGLVIIRDSGSPS